MTVKKPVGRALETLDHLLWAAVIDETPPGISKAFEKILCHGARVVYRCTTDPREKFTGIWDYIKTFIIHGQPVWRVEGHRDAYLSRPEIPVAYRSFVEKCTPAEDDVIQLVRIGFSDDILAPCAGMHLGSTAELSLFKITLVCPVKVGKDTYEFRFFVSEKETWQP